MDATQCRLGRAVFNTASASSALEILQRWHTRPERTPFTTAYINPHVYNCAIADADLLRFLRECDLVCVDGVGISLAARYLSGSRLPRTPATHLFEAWAERQRRSFDVVLIGTTELEVERAAAHMTSRFDAVRVIRAVDGFRELDAYDSLLAEHADVDGVFVGAGTPKSERILVRARRVCRRALCFHLGAGTIKLYAGTKRRAPRWMSRAGVEWLHRLVLEPHTRSRYVSGAVMFATDLMHFRSRNHEDWKVT